MDKYIAAIDIGTNSFHLIIARIKGKKFTVVEKRKIVLRLNPQADSFNNYISTDKLNCAIEVLTDFKKIADQYDAPVKAIATSAVREANNRNLFIQEIFNKTGISVKIINGDEEATYLFEGISRIIKLKDKKCISLDIGGGSTEIVYSNSLDVLYKRSYKMGAVRMSNMFMNNFVVEDSAILKIKNYVNELLNGGFDERLLENEFAVGASGTIQTIGVLCYFHKHKVLPRTINKFKFTKKELDEIIELLLAKKTSEEREILMGMDVKRADILPAGSIILQTIADKYKIKQFVISNSGLREGIILDSIRTNSII